MRRRRWLRKTSVYREIELFHGLVVVLTHLFHQTIWFEFVAVGEATHQRPLSLFVDTHEARIGFWTTEGLAIELETVDGVLGLFAGISRVRAGASSAGALLVSLTIEKKVAKDATWAPEETISPALNTALVFIEYKDRARSDHFTL